jgi:hypothetical protein
VKCLLVLLMLVGCAGKKAVVYEHKCTVVVASEDLKEKRDYTVNSDCEFTSLEESQ